MDSLAKRLSKRKNRDESGFSLVDVVVTVAIIVALSVGGFVSYNGLINNAKQGAVDYAASNVYKAALVYESDSNKNTNACNAVDQYNASGNGIKVSLMVPQAGAANPPRPNQFDYYYGAKGGPNGEVNTYTC